MGKADYLLSTAWFKTFSLRIMSKARGMFLDRFQMKQINNAVIFKLPKVMVLDSCCVPVVYVGYKFELADSVPFVNCLQTWFLDHSGINNLITNTNLIIASDS